MWKEAIAFVKETAISLADRLGAKTTVAIFAILTEYWIYAEPVEKGEWQYEKLAAMGIIGVISCAFFFARFKEKAPKGEVAE